MTSSTDPHSAPAQQAQPSSSKSRRTDRPVAIVTGASRGIGRGIAEHLGRAGYAVVVNYLRDATAAAAVVADVQAAGGEAVAVQGDIGHQSARELLIAQALHHWQRLDLLVNNAGITSPGRPDLLAITEEGFDQVFATNLKGPFFLAQLAARTMIELRRSARMAHGTIVNISSISAFTCSLNRGDYCLAKAALPMMTQLLAARLAEDNILVYDVCPGIIATDMTAPVQAKYDQLLSSGLAPLRRWGQPGDIGATVVQLASGALPYCTGQTIYIDGGFHIRQL